MSMPGSHSNERGSASGSGRGRRSRSVRRTVLPPGGRAARPGAVGGVRREEVDAGGPLLREPDADDGRGPGETGSGEPRAPFLVPDDQPEREAVGHPHLVGGAGSTELRAGEVRIRGEVRAVLPRFGDGQRSGPSG
ncbi:hypothetical protein GCM10010275_51080 [Streptomyces litmocidini]|nr:hypothetical protein GCM10010275_51080 [Streptomyces litmocidini]